LHLTQIPQGLFLLSADLMRLKSLAKSQSSKELVFKLINQVTKANFSGAAEGP
jgi:hypothetical protein